jgi:RNA polymerase sigma factor (sigma-70 family)
MKKSGRPNSRTDRAEAIQDLVVRCQKDDAAAWREFVDRFANLVYSTLLRFDVDAEDRAEVFQSSFVAMHAAIGQLRDPTRLPGWIIAIVSRQAVSSVRARIRRRRIRQDLVVGDAIRDTLRGAEAPLPDEEISRLEERHLIAEAIGTLPGNCRRLLTHLFLDDPPKSYDEIAARERIPRGSLGPTRRRCLERLRSALLRTGWLT